MALLLEEGNFSAEVEVRNVAGYEGVDTLSRLSRALAGRLLPRRRDHLFGLGRKVGPPRYALPEALYRSFDRERMRREGIFAPRG